MSNGGGEYVVNDGRDSASAPIAGFSRLQLAATHVAYSLTRLRALPPLTVDASLPEDARLACIESYFTHLRLCVEFFARRPDRYGRDFHATDYLPTWTAEQQRLTELWEFTSQNVSHFSRKRLPGAEGFTLQSVDPIVLSAHADRVFDLAVEFTEQLREHEAQHGVGLGSAFTFASALADVGRAIDPDEF